MNECLCAIYMTITDSLRASLIYWLNTKYDTELFKKKIPWCSISSPQRQIKVTIIKKKSVKFYHSDWRWTLKWLMLFIAEGGRTFQWTVLLLTWPINPLQFPALTAQTPATVMSCYHVIFNIMTITLKGACSSLITDTEKMQ